MPFSTNVFINCPFDDEFRLLLKPLLFTTLYLGFEPQIAQTFSSSEIRINQIKELIRESKFGIHDLSRSDPMKKGELPRFNMPYELGLDVGSSEFGTGQLREKKILIFEAEQYHYQKVLSDIAGQDIDHHNNSPELLITKLRNWFSTINVLAEYPSGSWIWAVFNEFNAEISRQLLDRKFTESEIKFMPISDFIKYAKDWIGKNKS